MNDMNPWEKQLESWTPHRPSERLKQRLFEVKRERTTESRPTPLWAWLTPATSLLVLALSLDVWLAREQTHGYASTTGSSNMLAMALPDLPPDIHARENDFSSGFVAVAGSDRRAESHSTSNYGPPTSLILEHRLVPSWNTNFHF
jgi:hypothetical protein